MKLKISFFKQWDAILLVLLAAEILCFGLINESFLNIKNLLYSTNDFMHIMLVSLPLTLVIITGGIDVSIGSIMGLASIIFGVLWKFLAFPLWLSFVVSLGVGLLAGFINGLLVAYTDINSLVLTLGTMFLFQGLATGLAGSIGASGYNGIGGFPESFTNIAYGAFWAVPYAFIFVILLGFLIFLLLNRTPLGRSLYLIGVNKNAAIFSGIKVKRVIISSFIFAGLGSALAGIFLTAYFTSSRSDLGKDVLMPALTSVVFGGTSITGGAGAVSGTFIAALFLGYLKQGLMAIGVTSDVSQVTVGIILIATVIIKGIAIQSMLNRMNRLAFKKATVLVNEHHGN
jgi:AI-2 transport system permease protein